MRKDTVHFVERLQSVASEVDGNDVEFVETSLPLTPETKHREKVIDQLLHPTFNSHLGSHPDSPYAALPAANVVRR